MDTTTTAPDTTCRRCTQRITMAASGRYVTGHDGWILPSHLNATCDGIHLHDPEVAPTTTCPDTVDGAHDWLPFERPACTHNGGTATTTTPAMSGRTCGWCGETQYTEA